MSLLTEFALGVDEWVGHRFDDGKSSLELVNSTSSRLDPEALHWWHLARLRVIPEHRYLKAN
jgi:hypothetical protein